MNKVIAGKLPSNRMPLFTQADSSAHVGGVFVRVGGMHDPPGKIGLTHLVEHLMFNRSLNYTQDEVENIVEECAQGWGGINISTDHYATAYVTDHLVYKADIDITLGMIADLIKNPIIERDDFRSEVASVFQEYNENGFSPYSVLYNEVMRMIFGGSHPVTKRIDCEPDDLKSITLRDIGNFRRRYYVPRNMGLILFGHKADEAQRIGEKLFGSWGRSSMPMPLFENPPAYAPLGVTLRRGIPMADRQYHVMYGFPTSLFCAKDHNTAVVLGRLLARRLFKRLRLKNYEFGKGIYHVSDDLSHSFAHGALCVSFSSTSREFIEWSEEVVLQECRQLRDLKRKSDGRFADASIGAVYRMYREAFYTLPGVLADFVIAAACNGDDNLEMLNGWRESVGSITIPSICDAADKYLCGNFAKVTVGPGYQEPSPAEPVVQNPVVAEKFD